MAAGGRKRKSAANNDMVNRKRQKAAKRKKDNYERDQERKKRREAQKQEAEEEEYNEENNERSIANRKGKGKCRIVPTAQENNNNNNEVESLLQKDVDGKILISMRAYSVEGGNKEEGTTVSNIVGTSNLNMSAEQCTRILVWFKELRKRVCDFYKDRIIELFLKNAKDKGYGQYTSIQKLQEAWADADTEEKQLTVGRQLNEIFHTGYFERNKRQGENGWKFIMEKECMEHLKLAYIPNENKTNERSVACLARQATRMRSDVMKRIRQKGKQKHGMIVTKRGTKKEKRKGPKGATFDESFVRKTTIARVKQKKGGRRKQGTDEEADDPSSSATESERTESDVNKQVRKNMLLSFSYETNHIGSFFFIPRSQLVLLKKDITSCHKNLGLRLAGGSEARIVMIIRAATTRMMKLMKAAS